MAQISDAVITFEIEPIVKLRCENIYCKHYLSEFKSCNLKHITIGFYGTCENSTHTLENEKEEINEPSCTQNTAVEGFSA